MREMFSPVQVLRPFAGEAAFPAHPMPEEVYEEWILKEGVVYHPAAIGNLQ
jgi:hypothetical protein